MFNNLIIDLTLIFLSRTEDSRISAEFLLTVSKIQKITHCDVLS